MGANAEQSLGIAVPMKVTLPASEFLLSPPSPGSVPGLRGFLRMMRRRWLAFLAGALGTVGLSAVLVLTLPTRYSAEAVVLVENRLDKVVNIESVVSALRPDVEAVESEIQVLRSRDLAKRVIERTGLAAYYEDRAGQLRRSICPWLIEFGLAPYLDFVVDCFAAVPPAVADQVEWFLKDLSVKQSGKSRAITVSFSSADAQLAAKVANTLAELYLQDQVDLQARATERASIWLGPRVEELRTRVLDAERAVEQFRASAGLTQGATASVIALQVTNATGELSQAQARLAATEARQQQFEALSRAKGDRRSAVRAWDEPVLVALSQQLAELERRRADTMERLGERHPTMISLNAEIAEMNRRLDVELNRAVQAIRNEVQIERVRTVRIAENLTALQSRSDALNQKDVHLRALEREAAALRGLYENFLHRSKETSEQRGLEQADSRIISLADVPTRPSFPNPVLFLGGAVAISWVWGLVLVLVAEQLDAGFVDSAALRQQLALPLLAIAPLVPTPRRSAARLSSYVTDKPFSLAAESARSIVTSLTLAGSGPSAISILICSAVANEGKTTIATWVARAAAQSALRVIVIDGDTRNPNLHRSFGGKNELGFSELLLGQARVPEVIKHDVKSGVDYISSGRRPIPSYGQPHLIEVQELIEGLKRQYDLVVIDSPPLMAIADGLLFSRIADQTLFVCRWRRTNRIVALRGLEQLQVAGARVTGAILSMVNLNRHGQYSEEYSRRSLRDMRKYYAD
jgi:succinoglycan biosynthesis transport protein ExoP